MDRTSWDDTWMNVARDVALRSRCSRAQCGAVIVTPEQRVAATGYNGPPRNWTGQLVTPDGRQISPDESCRSFCERSLYGPTPMSVTSYEDCPSIHAEMNALMHSSRQDREGGTIYITGLSCFNCTKAISNSGLRRVVMAKELEDRSYRDTTRSIKFFKDTGLRVDYG